MISIFALKYRHKACKPNTRTCFKQKSGCLLISPLTLYKFLKLKCLEAYLGLRLRLRHTGLGTAAVAEESTAGEAVHPLHVAAEAVRHLIDAAKVALRLRGDTAGEPPYLLCPNLPPHLLPSLKTKTIVLLLWFVIRLHQEAELKLLEEETAKRLEEAIQKNVEERLNSEDVKLDIERRVVEGRKKLFDDVSTQLQKEKESALAEARLKQEQARREREELDKMLEENKRRVEEAQRREALEQQRKEEERYRELEMIQRQKEEAGRRKKLEEEEEHAKQMKLGRNKSRTKAPFGIGL
ncbi:hypothetical protein Gotri_026254 [Gossypium trilobum]|uniref:Uncharacterized protein n=1 Tax=Gossypium trilobum TaxID=34281 RepID=A0A7J9FVQ7_9ROSI|nr:hypothetical protein [Gossypium trilobum]